MVKLEKPHKIPTRGNASEQTPKDLFLDCLVPAFERKAGIIMKRSEAWTLFKIAMYTAYDMAQHAPLSLAKVAKFSYLVSGRSGRKLPRCRPSKLVTQHLASGKPMLPLIPDVALDISIMRKRIGIDDLDPDESTIENLLTPDSDSNVKPDSDESIIENLMSSKSDKIPKKNPSPVVSEKKVPLVNIDEL